MTNKPDDMLRKPLIDLVGEMTKILTIKNIGKSGEELGVLAMEAVDKAKAAIQAKYILKSDVVEALGEDENIKVAAGRQYDPGTLKEAYKPMEIRNKVRAEIRGKLGL